MASLSTNGTTILNNYDRFTGAPFNAVKVTTYYDGTAMDDTKVDNAIYFKNSTDMGGGYSKRAFEGAISPRWFGAKGDGTTDDTTALNTMFAKIPAGSTVDFGGDNYVYIVQGEMVIPNKFALTLTGTATIKGKVRIGTLGVLDPVFTFQTVIEKLRFDFTNLVPNQNNITIANAQDITIRNCRFRNGDKAIIIAPVDKDTVTNPALSKLHVARLQVMECRVELDFARTADLRAVNYFLYVDNISQTSPVQVCADFSVIGNLGMFANICQIEIFGIDGITISNNTLFGSGGFYMNQNKTYNIHIKEATWTNIIDNNIFEAGYDGIKLEKVTNFIVNDNQIAWPGQRDATVGYGISIQGAGQRVEATYNTAMINDNIIRLPTKSGIYLGPGTNYVGVNNNVIVGPGNVSHYYGTGKKADGSIGAMGDGLCVPLITGAHYGIDNDSSNLGCLITSNQCNEADYNFPVDDAVTEVKRSRHANNIGIGGFVENYSRVIGSITSNIIDGQNVEGILFNVTSGGTVTTITGGVIGQLLMLSNGSNPITVTNNSTSMKLANNTDAVIPFRGLLVLKRQSAGVWVEISRTFGYELLSNKSTDGTLAANSTTLYPSQSAVKTYADAVNARNRFLFPVQAPDLHAITNNFELFYSTNGAANSPVTGYANGIQTAINNDTNFRNQLIMAGADKLYYSTQASGTWQRINRVKFFTRYSTVATSINYFPSYYDEVIDSTNPNLVVTLSADGIEQGVTKVFRNATAGTLAVVPNTGVTMNGTSGGINIPSGYRLTIFSTTPDNWIALDLVPINTDTSYVSSITIATANGLNGSVSGTVKNPILTVGTSVTGIVKGNGAAFIPAVANTDYLPVASPTMSGTPTAPTAAPGTNNTQVASTAFVQAALPTPISLTTTGTSGAATLSGSVLNIPNYATSGGGSGVQRLDSFYTNIPAPTTNGTVYSFVVPANTFTLDGQYLEFRIDMSNTAGSTSSIGVFFGTGTSLFATGLVGYTTGGYSTITGRVYRSSSTTTRSIVEADMNYAGAPSLHQLDPTDQPRNWTINNTFRIELYDTVGGNSRLHGGSLVFYS